jgi:hypothetical protein
MTGIAKMACPFKGRLCEGRVIGDSHTAWSI